MAINDTQGNWLDSSGNKVPTKYIDPVDKKRDQVVERLFKQAQQAHARLAAFKAMVMEEIEKYLVWLSAQAGEDALNVAATTPSPAFPAPCASSSKSTNTSPLTSG